MPARYLLLNSKGFTLIELIAVLVILSTLFALVIPRFIDLAESAERKALDFAIAELDSRECLAWAKIKLSVPGWQNDDEVRAHVDYNLGSEYSWRAGPEATGGTLDFKAKYLNLHRTESTNTSAPDWH